MSVEVKPAERVFTIRKQTFRDKFRHVNSTWAVKIKAYDEHGEEDHNWEITCLARMCDIIIFLSLRGGSQNKNIKYERCYCKFIVYNKDKREFTIRKETTRKPNFGDFDFTDVYYLGDEDSHENYIDISFTIASCDENKRKPIEPQKAMLDQEILTDMVIKTKEHEFPCHKVILAAESEYFRTMFQSDMKEKRTSVVEWTDVFEASVVKDLLHFFYTGKKPPNIRQNKFKLLEAAHLCQLSTLKDMCANRIEEDIDVANAGRVLETSEIYELDDLKTVALKFVAANNQVLETAAYQEIDVNIKLRILSSFFKVFQQHLTNILS